VRFGAKDERIVRKTHQWTAIAAVALLLTSLGLAAPPTQVVRAVTAISQVGLAIDGEAAGDWSGQSVAMSGDGTTIAIGAPYNDDNGTNSGHVRVYTRTGTTWEKIGSDINGEAAGDGSGYSVAMSRDGTTIAIGAPGNNVTGTRIAAGHVRVYTLTNGSWTKTGDDIDGEAAFDQSGYSVAMSEDGTRIAIGANLNDGENRENSGHVRVYTLTNGSWTKTGSDIDGEAAGDGSGYSVAMSRDGTTIAIGAPYNSTGTRFAAGHVRVYTLTNGSWTKTGDDIDGEAAFDQSGYSVAMSEDGTRIAIGAPLNDDNDNSNNCGHVRIYTLNGAGWERRGDDINGQAGGDWSGRSVAMSADGTRIAIGGLINVLYGTDKGRVRIYIWDGTTWEKTGDDIDGEAVGDFFGGSIAMSRSGKRIAIGATENDNNNGINSGHVRVYAILSSPTAPTISSVTPTNGSLTVAFTPGTDGGTSITNYKYSVDGTNYVALNPATTTSPFTISGLTNGTTYSVTIKAVNEIGDSPASNAMTGVVPDVPRAPTISSVSANNGSLTVAFTPGTDGGSAITNYKYSVDGTNYVALNPATTTSPFTISGLTNSTTYSVTIKAVNGVGDSPASNAITASPTATSTTQSGLDIDGEDTDDQSGYSVAMSQDGTRIAIGAPFNDGNGSNAGHVRVYTLTNGAWTITGADIDGAAAGDYSGWSVAMSADGTRIAIGSRDGGPNLEGQVRVFTWSGTTWTQTGLDINGETAGDESGTSVAMSRDGTRIAIGAPSNNSNAGHVRVYTLTNGAWTITGADIDGENANDQSGSSVAMSADGTRIAIGASGNNGNGNNSGHVRIYTLTNGAWTRNGADIVGENANDESGSSVAMSADGTRIAIGATGNDGTSSNSGHVRVYTLTNGAWTKTGEDIDGETADDRSGTSVAMSQDGTRIAVGATGNDFTGNNAGHVRIHTLTNGAWPQTGVDIDGEATGDLSGGAVAMSASGTHIAIGAKSNRSLRGQVRVYEVLASPTPPTISSVTPANGSLTVAFAPGTDGGSAITNYKYSVDGTNYVALNPATTTSPFTISDLTNGTTYSVTIKAVNAIGDSPASNAVTGSPTAPTTSTVAPTTTTPTTAVTTTTTPTTPTTAVTTTTPTTTPTTAVTTTTPTPTTTTPTTVLVATRKTVSIRTGTTSLLTPLIKASEISIPKDSKVTGSISNSLKSVCKTSGIKIVGITPGKCIVKIKIMPKKGRASTKLMPVNIIGSPIVKRGASITLTNVAAAAGLTTGNGLFVEASIAKASTKLCKVSRSKIAALKAGRCLVTLTVKSSSGATSTKQLRINVS